MQADICQLGNDQRKVNMLAREYCDLTKRKLKPIIVSHPMLPGLKEGQEKMSKSDPESAIFMEDSAADVKTKIKKAFCPPQVVEGNPCLGYVRHIILPWAGMFLVRRKEEHGGDKCAVVLLLVLRQAWSELLCSGSTCDAALKAMAWHPNHCGRPSCC